MTHILHFYFYTVIAVATHRLVLLGTEAVSIIGIFRWGKRELKFALYVLLLDLAVRFLGGLVFFAGFEMGPRGFMRVFLILVGIVAIVASRFSLVFPGIAIDEQAPFGDSWEMSKGYSILMLCVVGVAPIVLMYPVLAIEAQEHNLTILSNPARSIILVLVIAFLSCAYNEINKRKTAC
ncbi:MAG: hypothetical protein GY702_24460 [Desulfobulbaceae bacterium]|nr:hypothetical protein [Desulfobulbaceae bacterium]